MNDAEVPLNPAQSTRLIDSLIRLIRQPDRLQEIFLMAEAVSEPATMRPIVAAFASTDEGARALRERIRVGPISLPALRVLPRGSLGHAFADHLDSNRLDPASIPTLEARDETEYVKAHLLETHDIWHTVTGFGTDPAGELGLQAFSLSQFPARLSALLIGVGLINIFFHSFDERATRMDEIALGWTMGKRVRSLLGLDWKTMWPLPLVDIRQRLRLTPRTAGDTAIAP